MLATYRRRMGSPQYLLPSGAPPQAHFAPGASYASQSIGAPGSPMIAPTDTTLAGFAAAASPSHPTAGAAMHQHHADEENYYPPDKQRVQAHLSFSPASASSAAHGHSPAHGHGAHGVQGRALAPAARPLQLPKHAHVGFSVGAALAVPGLHQHPTSSSSSHQQSVATTTVAGSVASASIAGDAALTHRHHHHNNVNMDASGHRVNSGGYEHPDDASARASESESEDEAKSAAARRASAAHGRSTRGSSRRAADRQSLPAHGHSATAATPSRVNKGRASLSSVAIADLITVVADDSCDDPAPKRGRGAAAGDADGDVVLSAHNNSHSAHAAAVAVGSYVDSYNDGNIAAVDVVDESEYIEIDISEAYSRVSECLFGTTVPARAFGNAAVAQGAVAEPTRGGLTSSAQMR